MCHWTWCVLNYSYFIKYGILKVKRNRSRFPLPCSSTRSSSSSSSRPPARLISLIRIMYVHCIFASYWTYPDSSNYHQAELAIVATDLAELLGSAIALNLIFPSLPLWAGVLLTSVDVLVILAISDGEKGKPARLFELIIVFLVSIAKTLDDRDKCNIFFTRFWWSLVASSFS